MSSAAFTGLAHYCDKPTDRPTDRPRYSVCNSGMHRRT